jgi:hypothetical protein
VPIFARISRRQGQVVLPGEQILARLDAFHLELLARAQPVLRAQFGRPTASSCGPCAPALASVRLGHWMAPWGCSVALLAAERYR